METYDSFLECLINLHKVSIIYFAGFVTVMAFLLASTGRNAELKLMILPILSYGGDVIAAYFTDYLGGTNNHWFYNLVEIPLLLLTAYAFYFYAASPMRKRVFGWGTVLLLSYHMGYLLIWGDLYRIDLIGICYGMIITSAMAYMCLVQLVETFVGKLASRLLFWFAFASFIFYIGRIPITALTFGAPNMSDELYNNMYKINDVLYVLWYGIIIIGVIYTTKWTKESTSP